MSGLQLPSDMFNMSLPGGGLQAMNAENLGFQDPAANKNVALASEFVESGFNVVTTAARSTGQDTQGFDAYKEIKQSGEQGHVATLEAARAVSGNLRMQDGNTISVPNVAGVSKSDAPSLG